MKIKILMLLLTALTSFSCTSFLEEQIYSDAEEDMIFKNYSDAEMSVKNCYSVLHDDLYGWVLQSINSVGTDELLCRAPIFSFIRLSDYSLTAGDNNIQSAWTGLYKGIYRCNDTYFKIEKMTQNISDKSKLALQSEVLFLRSFFYFHLVQMWGGVRLNVVEPTFAEVVRNEVSRASVEEVYLRIAADLETATKGLPETQQLAGRITCYTAHALLAKVYLAMASGAQFGVAGHDNFDPAYYYDLAKKNAQIVMEYAISSGQVGLMENYRDIFSANHKYNKENLFEASFVINGAGSNYPVKGGPEIAAGSPYGPMVCALSGENHLRPTAYLALHIYGHTDAITYKDVETSCDITYIRSEDTRFVHNIGHWRIPKAYIFSGNIDGDIPDKMAQAANLQNWSITKFAMKTTDQTLFHRYSRPVNFPLIRYADVLLTYAEAAGMLNLGDHTAYQAVNQVRSRARMVGTSPAYLADWSAGQFSSTEDFVNALLDERMREFCFEGHRRLDLLRTGRLFWAIDRMAIVDRTYTDPAKPGFDFTKMRELMIATDITYPQYEVTMKPHHVLLPIPQYEMNIVQGVNYPQNPGWQSAPIEDGGGSSEEE